MDAIMLGKEIARLKGEQTTWFNIDRLAKLLVVYDHLADSGTPIIAQQIIDVLPDDVGDGEFREAIAGKEVAPLIETLEEHLMVIKTVYPKEYQALIQRVRDLP